MKGSKLFKNVRLKGQKELVSILVEDGIFKKIAADIPREKTVGCEEVDLNGQALVRKMDQELFLKESSVGVNQKEI